MLTANRSLEHFLLLYGYELQVGIAHAGHRDGVWHRSSPRGSVLLRLDGLEGATVVGAFRAGKWLEAEKVGQLGSTNFTLYGPTGKVSSRVATSKLETPDDICQWNRNTRFKVTGERALSPLLRLRRTLEPHALPGQRYLGHRRPPKSPRAC